MREFLEKPRARPDRHEPHLRRRLRARALGARPDPAATQNVSIEREVWPRLVGDGLYGFARRGLLARHRHARALPAGDVRHPRGQRPDARAASASATATSSVEDADAVDGRVVPPGARRARLPRSPRAPTSARLVVLGRGRDGRRGRRRSSARSCSTARGSAPAAPLRDCIVARRARAIGDARAGRRAARCSARA